MEQQPPTINTEDMKILLTSIDIASKRGAFSAKEFAKVGYAYDRVTNFVEYTEANAVRQSNEATNSQPSHEDDKPEENNTSEGTK